MRVGIHLPYRPTELGYAAVRVADFACSLGIEVEFHTLDDPRPIEPRWDRRVITEAVRPFADWVRSIKVLIAMEPVSEEYFAAANRAMCKVVLWATLDALQDDLKGCYEMADEIICPTKSCIELLNRNWGFSHCRLAPWDPGLPVTRKVEPIGERVRVMFPIHGRQASVASDAVLNLVWRTMQACPTTDVTLTYNPKSLGASGHHAVKAIARLFPEQFRAISDRGLTRADLLMEYGRHDIVAWTAETDGFGSLGLDALSMGTPVAAYDVAPHSEFLSDGRNSRLIPCELRYNSFGVPWAVGDLSRFEAELVKLIGQPKVLAGMNRFTRYGLSARREQFIAGWRHALAI